MKFVVRYLQLVFLLLLLPGAKALAYLGDEPDIPGFNQLETLLKYSTDKENSFEAGLGYRLINNDHFISLDARVNLNLGPGGLGLETPLNFRVYDNEPKETHDYTALRIRHEDWDGGVEWLRILRYVRLGNKGETFYLRFGELTGDIGHLTIVGHYDNNMDVNAFHSGLAFDLNLDYGGVEMLTNDLFQLGSKRAGTRLLATRVHINPVTFVNKDSYAKRLAVGFTVATDIGAPTALSLDSAGNVAVYDNKPKAEKSANTTIIGIDAEFKVFDNETVAFTPYFDINFIAGAGMGFHLGASGSLRFKLLKGLSIPMRLEYRVFRSDYLPNYFNSFYDIERYQYGLDVRAPTTKRQYLTLNGKDKTINGIYGEFAFDLMHYVQFGLIFEYYAGAAANLSFFLNVPAWERAQFTLFYTRTDIRGGRDIFSFDNRTLFLALAKVRIIKFLYAAIEYSRTWQLNELDGQYDAVNDLNIGVIFRVAF